MWGVLLTGSTPNVYIISWFCYQKLVKASTLVTAIIMGIISVKRKGPRALVLQITIVFQRASYETAYKVV